MSVEFAREAQARVVLGEGLRFVPVRGDERVGEGGRLAGFGLLADLLDAGAVLLLLDFAAHRGWWVVGVVCVVGVRVVGLLG